MHTLKSLFISVYLMALLAAAGVALWQIATDGTAAWWGVLLAAAVPLGFFTWVFVGSVARTGDTLWWVPAAGTFGTAVSASIGGLSTPTWVAMAVGMVMGALYTRWYSRFGERSAPQLMAGQPLPDFPLENLDGTPLRSTDLTGQPALWLFYRGNWCPLCMAQIKEIAGQYRELAARGVQICLISPQPQDHTRSLAGRFSVPMRFFTDRDNRAAAQLGILAKGGLPLGMQALGYDADVPMPTVLITAAGGKLIYSDLTDNYRIRPEPAAFLSVLDQTAGSAQ
jgi:peroxiredoxin